MSSITAFLKLKTSDFLAGEDVWWLWQSSEHHDVARWLPVKVVKIHPKMLTIRFEDGTETRVSTRYLRKTL